MRLVFASSGAPSRPTLLNTVHIYVGTTNTVNSPRDALTGCIGHEGLLAARWAVGEQEKLQRSSGINVGRLRRMVFVLGFMSFFIAIAPRKVSW